ncbi:hypothetical protein RFI_36832, partial [Reticulomyxa filosa]
MESTAYKKVSMTNGQSSFPWPLVKGPDKWKNFQPGDILDVQVIYVYMYIYILFKFVTKFFFLDHWIGNDHNALSTVYDIKVCILDDLFVCDMWKNKIHHDLKNRDMIAEVNRHNDDIVVYY